jgi:hypothetical protein
MQKKSLKKFYPSLSPLMPQAIPRLASLNDKFCRPCRQTAKRQSLTLAYRERFNAEMRKTFPKKQKKQKKTIIARNQRAAALPWAVPMAADPPDFSLRFSSHLPLKIPLKSCISFS